MFMKEVSVIHRFGHVFIQRKLREYNLNGPEPFVIKFLNEQDGVNQDKISYHFTIDKGGIAKTLAKLEESGYIKREINTNNKREKNVHVTQKGKELVSTIDTILNQWDSIAMEGLSEEEEIQFINLLSKVSSNVKAAVRQLSEKGADLND